MLMHHSDPRIDRIGRGIDDHLLVVHQYFPFIRLVETIKDIHQRSFACAVLSQQRQNFSLIERQVNMIIRQHSGETLCYSFKLKNRSHVYSICEKFLEL